jgi:hypothetical protein
VLSQRLVKIALGKGLEDLTSFSIPNKGAIAGDLDWQRATLRVHQTGDARSGDIRVAPGM